MNQNVLEQLGPLGVSSQEAKWKQAVYPGSFEPWHKGHVDIVRKALKVFDHICIAKGINPFKDTSLDFDQSAKEFFDHEWGHKVSYITFSGLLVDLVRQQNFHAVIRGLRNGHDLQYEMNQQYWNEDLGLEVPVVYFITDRNLSHISSTAVRTVNQLRSTNNNTH